MKLVEWAQAVLTEVDSGYAYFTPEKLLPLPDVMVHIERTTITNQRRKNDFGIEQTMNRIHDCRVSFMVDADDHLAAATQLDDFEERLTESALADGTLGGRVPNTNPEITFASAPAFVEYEDGTRGREVVMSVEVIDSVGVQQ